MPHIKVFLKINSVCSAFFPQYILHYIFVDDKQARKLQATLVRNYHRVTHSLTGVECRATSVAKDIET